MLGPLMRWGFMIFVILFVAAMMPTLTTHPHAVRAAQDLSPAERRKRTVLHALRLINAHDWDALRALLSATFVLHHPTAGDLDCEGYIRFLQALQRAMPCLTLEHDCVATADEWVMVHCTLVEEQTQTRVGGVSVFRVEDELLTTAYLMLDESDLLPDLRAA
ncbi:MAG: nuclear transport factor 2 family protein [Anaerolineae bacterium]|nr:nuclear transport factor 2 family protein [Anaerolineae bacterium]